jgi:hydrogenase-4 component E
VSTELLGALNAFAGAVFLLAAFGMVATRQAMASLRLFVVQSVALAASAFLLAAATGGYHLWATGGITLATKAILLPWLLRRTIQSDVYARREVEQVLNIPTSLLLALVLVLFAYGLSRTIGASLPELARTVNLPVGIGGLLLAAYTLTVRREAVPQVMGLLALENGAFFVGIAVASELSVIAELAAAFDVIVAVVVLGLLTRRIQERLGTTSVGRLTSLRETGSRREEAEP